MKLNITLPLEIYLEKVKYRTEKSPYSTKPYVVEEVYFELYSFPWKIYEDLNDIKENKEFDHVQILYMLRIIKLRMM